MASTIGRSAVAETPETLFERIVTHGCSQRHGAPCPYAAQVGQARALAVVGDLGTAVSLVSHIHARTLTCALGCAQEADMAALLLLLHARMRARGQGLATLVPLLSWGDGEEVDAGAPWWPAEWPGSPSGAGPGPGAGSKKVVQTGKSG